MFARRTTVRSALVAAVGSVVVLVAGMLAGLAAAVAAPAAGGNWHVASVLALDTESTGIGCLPTKVCWALESGRLLSSTDAGVTWTDRTDLVPAGIVGLADVACAPNKLCYALATDDTGADHVFVLGGDGTLTDLAGPGDAALVTIDCPSQLTCFVSDGTTVWSSTDGAHTWQPHALPAIVYSFAALGCVPHTIRCWIVGDRGETPLIERTTNGGTSWTQQTAPVPTDGLHDVACPTALICYAVGADFSDYTIVITTTDGGASWHFANVSFSYYALRSVSCTGDLVCRAVGQSPGDTPFLDATTDGQTWSQQTLSGVTTASPAKVSCTSGTECAVMATGNAYHSVGDTWSRQPVPTAVEAPNFTTCPRTDECLAAGTTGGGVPFELASADHGATWTRRDFPAGTGRITGLTCPTATYCYALALATGSGGHPNTQALYSTDAGQTWARGRLAIGDVTLGNLTCPGRTTCLAAGYASNGVAPRLMRSTDGGHTWQVLTPPSSSYLTGLACGSLTSCVALSTVNYSTGETTAYVSTDLGSSFQTHPVPAGSYYSMACKVAMCIAVGDTVGGAQGAISVSNDGGVTWTSATVPPNDQTLSDATCGGPHTCAASAFDYNYTTGGPDVLGSTDGGATWHAFRVPARREQPFALSCLGGSCLAADVSQSGNPIILAGTA